jgi:lysophospholipase L1-like esterase
MLTAVVFLAAPVFAGRAHGATGLSSGPWGGPIGTPVVSTIPYTAKAYVLVGGDSITVRSYRQLPVYLPGKTIAINAQSGRNTKLTVDQLLDPKVTPYLPAKLVMATGANDIFAPTAMAAQVQRLLAGAQARGVQHVYWVNASVKRPGWVLQDTWNSFVVNRAIATYCTGTCSVINWAGFLAQGTRRARLIDSGGVHPNVAGQAAWAALIAASVK